MCNIQIFQFIKPLSEVKTLSTKSAIASTFSKVRNFSFEEKKTNLLYEERVNDLLDNILDFKNVLKDKTERLIDINKRIESITWLNDIDEECLMVLNDIISSAKDLRSSLIRQYISINYLSKKGIAKEEIRDFKNSIDELKESYEDLESVFFFLPEKPDFIDTTKKLSLI